ncbi:oxidative stress-induced growth inhibitor 1 isoform X2 [Megalopta genalis]|uniref:oxidative stress-induced growth inhibitor 1 isoform X2 n=1 Tax=Megalopta genalis TaxID=115081 RepID=UPI003FD19306
MLRWPDSDTAGGIEATMQSCCDNKETNDLYKDVVIIGNGPSGICLSYMLAGNWPYYTGEPHPGDEMLTARLCSSVANSELDLERNGINNQQRWQNRFDGCERKNQDRCLARSTRCKLKCLSSGLEGRVGGRPLALLMDQLQHPGVDSGFDVPSLLTWKSREQNPEHKLIDHVVLGKGRPGGAWQSMDPNVLTISLNRWMSLPDLDIREWETMVESEQLRKTSSADATESYTHKTASRISVGTVAAYYDDYIRIKRLEQYFRCGTMVTSVKADRVSHGCEQDSRYGWIVEGFVIETGQPFRYRCKTVVLATGSTDSPNRLGIPGEDSQPEWVTHHLNDLEMKLDRLVNRRIRVDAPLFHRTCERSHRRCRATDSDSDEQPAKQIMPVLVIGAGLSAADAIMAARFRGIPVLHAFRDTSYHTEDGKWNKSEDEETQRIKYKKLLGLPSSMYPEYHKVYEMMEDGGKNYPLYRALPGYTLLEISEAGNDRHTNEPIRAATLSSPDGRVCSFRVSIVAILIGSKPDLSYLEGGGIGLGRLSDKLIDSKSNPIEVDDFTYEVIESPKAGLYALGPLVGDNFVRYILGGAFGILAHTLTTSTT